MARKEKRDEGYYYSRTPIKKIGAVYNLIVGTRNRGKTFQMLMEVLENYWTARQNGELSQGAYVRRYKDNLKSAAMSTIWDTVLCDGDRKNQVEILTNGMYDNVKYVNRRWYLCKTDPETGLVNRDVNPIMYAMDLSRAWSDKGSSYPHVDTIWYEEFLSPDKNEYLKDEFNKLKNLISTIVRDRTNVTVWLTGNVVDRHADIFREMGLDRVKDQEQGTIDTYKIGNTGKLIAVERTQDEGRNRESKASNDYYYAFGDPEKDMILSGSWEMNRFPTLEEEPRPIDIVGRFFVYYKTEILEGDVVCTDDGDAYIYLHDNINPLRPIDPDCDLIYTETPTTKFNYRTGFHAPLTHAEQMIGQLIRAEKIMYDKDETGDTFEAYNRTLRR